MILYFSGTGNSRYVANRLSELTGEAVESVNEALKGKGVTSLHSHTPWVVVSPVYAWRLPRVVEQFIRKASISGNTGMYFVLTCGGQVGAAARYARKLCAKKGLKFMGLSEVVMPENFITMFQAPEREEAEAIIRRAEPEIERIGKRIGAGEPFPAKRVGIGDRLLSGPVNLLFYPLFVKARGYHATEACTGCGTCTVLCPLNNIRMEDRRPVWGKNCTQCMACIGGCPAGAVEYGDKTRGKVRYYLSEEGNVRGGRR